jgi:hypothetical protein
MSRIDGSHVDISTVQVNGKAVHIIGFRHGYPFLGVNIGGPTSHDQWIIGNYLEQQGLSLETTEFFVEGLGKKKKPWNRGPTFSEIIGGTKAIDTYFYPGFLRGIRRYALAQRNKEAGKAISQDAFYLSEGFAEHLRNWQQAITTNYRGEFQEERQKLFSEFYERLALKIMEKAHKSE